MEEEDGLLCTVQPPLLDVVLSGSSPLAGLSFSTTPYCSTASLSLSLSHSVFFLLPWALSSLRPRPFLMPREHTQASSNMHPSHWHTLMKTDAGTDQDAEETHTHTIRKSLKGFLILSALSSLYHPQPILLSDCTVTPKKKVQFILRRRFGISQSLDMTFKRKIITQNYIENLI